MSTEVTLVEKLQSTQDLTQKSQTRGQQAAWLQLVCTNKHLAINVVSYHSELTQNNLHDIFLVMSVIVCVSKCRKHILFQI